MNTPARNTNLVAWAVLFLTMAAIGATFIWSRLAGRGRVDAAALPVYGQVSDFTLANQNGQVVSLADLRGKVWVADIIFTRCAGPCPTLTRHMADLQAALPAGSPVKLVTLTTDPEFDTPPVMKNYAQRFGANLDRWMFLTGTKREIANLAVGGLKLSAVEVKPEERASPEDLFIHSTIFVVVDKQARLRGVYQTTGPDVAPQSAKQQILAAVGTLLREN
jgi:protein SCO1/2